MAGGSSHRRKTQFPGLFRALPPPPARFEENVLAGQPEDARDRSGRLTNSPLAGEFAEAHSPGRNSGGLVLPPEARRRPAKGNTGRATDCSKTQLPRLQQPLKAAGNGTPPRGSTSQTEKRDLTFYGSALPHSAFRSGGDPAEKLFVQMLLARREARLRKRAGPMVFHVFAAWPGSVLAVGKQGITVQNLKSSANSSLGACSCGRSSGNIRRDLLNGTPTGTPVRGARELGLKNANAAREPGSGLPQFLPTPARRPWADPTERRRRAPNSSASQPAAGNSDACFVWRPSTLLVAARAPRRSLASQSWR